MPKSIQKQLNKRKKLRAAEELKAKSDDPEDVAVNIKQRVHALYNSSARRNMNSDELSREMVPFVAETEHLASRKGVKCTRLAISLVLYIAARSYRLYDNYTVGDGDRPSDKPADDLLYRLLPKMRHLDLKGTYRNDVLNDLRWGRSDLEEVVDQSFFEKSIKLLESWEAEAEGKQCTEAPCEA